MQVLHPDLLNENFRNAEYAVRGELYLKGAELKKAGRDIIFTNGMRSSAAKLISGKAYLPVTALAARSCLADVVETLKMVGNATVCCAVGNPQQLGQKPLTFNRQVYPPQPF